MEKKSKLITIGIIVLAILAIILVIILNSINDKKVYYAVFNDNNGNNFYVVKYNENEIVEEPVVPTKDGYEFSGWKYEGNEIKFGDTKINKNMTFIASWNESKKEYTISFKNADGTITQKTVTEGETIAEPTTPERDGYKFEGWTINGEKYDFSKPVTKDMLLEASWQEEKTTTEEDDDDKEDETVIKFTVSFNSAGGSSVKKQTVKEGDKATKPSNPTRKGYTFKGWTLNGKAYNFSTPVTKSITLVATWEEKETVVYTVTFDSAGGSSVASQSVEEGSKATKPSNPTKSGYVFKGWYLNGKEYNFNTAISSNIKLTAQWAANTYTVKASAVDSYSPDRTLKVYENGTAISVKAIYYTSGTLLCSGSNTTVAATDISGVSKVVVELTNGTKVTASLS